jgi:hypothetical protein
MMMTQTLTVGHPPSVTSSELISLATRLRLGHGGAHVGGRPTFLSWRTPSA